LEIIENLNLPKFEFVSDVLGRVLINGKNMTFFMVEIPFGKKVPLHSHPHEQMGICLAGEAEFSNRLEKKLVRKGMVYRFESNEKHEVKTVSVENSIFLDVFSPPRSEYVSMQKHFESANP
jgi:quercetin dioxygenase-like cupin family protein